MMEDKEAKEVLEDLEVVVVEPELKVIMEVGLL
jgi:hypothetical protein